MTTAADRADERAFEALLEGRAVPGEGAGLAAFTDAVRASATRPGRPDAALAELLTTGLLTHSPDPSARTAKRRRRSMWFFSAILAKIASAGAVAWASTAAGAVVVGVSTAGFAGALPAPVQHTFATVVDSVTPLTAPGSTSSTATPTTPAVTTPATTTPAATTTAPSPADVSGQAGESDSTESAGSNGIGDEVRSAASGGGMAGGQASILAHKRNQERRDAQEHAGTATVTEAPDSHTEAPETEASHTEAARTTAQDGSTSGGDSSSRDGGHGDH